MTETTPGTAGLPPALDGPSASRRRPSVRPSVRPSRSATFEWLHRSWLATSARARHTTVVDARAVAHWQVTVAEIFRGRTASVRVTGQRMSRSLIDDDDDDDVNAVV